MSVGHGQSNPDVGVSAARIPNGDVEISGSDGVESGEDVVDTTTHVTKASVLTESDQSSARVDVFGRGHVDASSGTGTLDFERHRAGRDASEVEAMQTNGTGRIRLRLLIEQHLSHRVLVPRGSDHGVGPDVCRPVTRPRGERHSDRWP